MSGCSNSAWRLMHTALWLNCNDGLVDLAVGRLYILQAFTHSNAHLVIQCVSLGGRMIRSYGTSEDVLVAGMHGFISCCCIGSSHIRRRSTCLWVSRPILRAYRKVQSVDGSYSTNSSLRSFGSGDWWKRLLCLNVVRLVSASPRHGSEMSRKACSATWLILPVVICLSQRLSHARLSINK